MARLIGPGEASREVKTIVATGTTKDLFRSKAARPATFYTDLAAKALADIRLGDGSTVTGSTVTIDAYSMLPLIQFPDGVDTLYVVVDGGPAWPVYAREDDRIDALGTRVTNLESGGASDELALHKAGAETVTGVKTFAVAPLVPTPTLSGEPAPKGYVDAAGAALGALVTAEASSRATADALLTPLTRTISTAAPVIGGGDLSTDRTIGVADATTGAKGVVQLAGDLTGSATLPVIAAGAVTSSKILDGTIVDGDINASAGIAQSKVSGLVTALAAKVDEDALVINVRDHGVVGDGVTDDSAAIRALSSLIPAAGGNEIGGAHIHFPKGIYLCNTPSAGTLWTLTSKPNVLITGAGDTSRIRMTTATAENMWRFETCTSLKIENISLQVIGTAKVTDEAIAYTTATPVGSAHEARFRNIKVSCNGTYRKFLDLMTATGVPGVYSAQAVFAAGDVGGPLVVDLANGPWESTIQSVATHSGTLAADITTTSATTVTLNAPLSGTVPTSGFTIQIGTELMLVTAGGTTTTLTVTRGLGADAVKTTHTTGDAVTTYSAVADSNAPSSTVNAVGAGRVQPATAAYVRVGLGVGTDHPGSPDLDIANTSIIGCIMSRCHVAGFQVGNGTSGDVLDHWAKHCSVGESGYWAYLYGGSLTIRDCDSSTNAMPDIRRFQPVSQSCVIDEFRSEGAPMVYRMTGAATAGPSTSLENIEAFALGALDGVVLQHLNSAPLYIRNSNFVASRVVAGTVLASISGTSSFPCHVIAENVGFSGGNSHFFSSVTAPTSILTVIGNPRISTVGNPQPNAAIGFYTRHRMVLGAGFAKTRTAVSDAAYTALTTDVTVAYTALTAARIVTLPAQSVVTAGQEFMVIDESGSCDATKTITVTPPSGTLNGASNVVLDSAYAKVTVYTNGTNWFIR